MLAPNTTLQNRYRIVRLLAQGGMGAVYQALDQNLGSTIAVKETLFTDDSLRNAFEREARLLANLRHAALPKVTHHFTEGDGQFLVMDFIPGDDLMRMLEHRGSPFPVEDVLEWADQLLGVLEYLHKRQPPIVHRDIKPHNLKLTEEGQIVLLDFGLAKGAAWQRSHLTTGSSIFGYTPSYAPPEQIKGTGTDPRSDLYSLGATLHHLITGQQPPDALTRVMELAEGQPDPLRPANEIKRHVTPVIASVLTQAMLLNRERRFSSATLMREALGEARTSLAASSYNPATMMGPATVEGFSANQTLKDSVIQAAEPAVSTSGHQTVDEEEIETIRPAGRSSRGDFAVGQWDQAPRRVIVPIRSRSATDVPVPSTLGSQATHAKGISGGRWLWGGLAAAGLTVLVIALSVAALKDAKPPVTSLESSQPSATAQPIDAGLTLGVFEFDTVTVDAGGNVTERRKGQATFFSEDLGNGVTLEMVDVPGGTFLMGSHDSEPGRHVSEGPQHSVSVAAFQIGKFEVSQAQWRVVAGLPKVRRNLRADPSRFKGENLPVEQVSWDDAVEFCERLSRFTERAYRLPTEAEWEYACRSGSTTPFAFGETITPHLVNHGGDGLDKTPPKELYKPNTIPVGSLGAPNAFGLFDMHGNVWEWCIDNWHDSYHGAPTDGRAWGGGDPGSRVARGGSWYYVADYCRSANRGRSSPDNKRTVMGFRVVSVGQTR